MDTDRSTIFTDDAALTLKRAIEDIKPDRVVVLADRNTVSYVVPRLALDSFPVYTAEAGDCNKTVAAATCIWEWLSATGVSRSSLMINVGGGMITDLGGFVASTFKRGIRYVNVASSLLGMVDASSGGKTGVNLGDLKNEVGVFNRPELVVVSPGLLSTLPREELLSGFGEMLKHGVIKGGQLFADTIETDPFSFHTSEFASLIRRNIDLKERITGEDPCEKGLRKTLNLGHTAGHAIETLSLRRGSPVCHGYAVAWGLLCESVLAHLLTDCSTSLLHLLAPVVSQLYGAPDFTCDDYPLLLDLMRHDKKNSGGKINFTLPEAPGVIRLDMHPSDEMITAALDILRDLTGA